MKGSSAASLILVALAASSCGGRQAVEMNAKTVSTANRWNGTLATPPELSGVADIRGSGWMAPDPKSAQLTLAHVNIANDVPGAMHPWHVHRGRCEADQGIFGPPDAYPPLKVDDKGRARSEAKLSVATPKTGEFFINVHASARNMKTIVACGNLAPPAQ